MVNGLIFLSTVTEHAPSLKTLLEVTCPFQDQLIHTKLNRTTCGQCICQPSQYCKTVLFGLSGTIIMSVNGFSFSRLGVSIIASSIYRLRMLLNILKLTREFSIQGNIYYQVQSHFFGSIISCVSRGSLAQQLRHHLGNPNPIFKYQLCQ